MKTVFVELLAFVLLCVFGTAAGGLLIMLYDSATNFVVGSGLSVFSARAFANGAILFFPILLLFAPMFLYLTLIRHPKYNKISGAIAIAVLTLAAWIFAVPVFYKAAKARNVFSPAEAQELTAGYFRKINGRIFYFTFVSGNYASGLRLSSDYFFSNNPENRAKALDSGRDFINFKRDEMGFSDPIIGESLAPPPIVRIFLESLFVLQRQGMQAAAAGTIEWLLFSSLMAALVSIGAVVSASEWRMADAFYISFDTLLILIANCLFFMGYFDGAIQALFDAGGIFALAARRFHLAINCAAISILLFLGIFKAIVHAARNKGPAQ